MGAMMRAVQWEHTVFGPVGHWPQSLRTAVSMMLESRFAMVVAWGPEFRFFYNDRYRPILGTKHPAALGTPAPEIFPEIWSVIGPEFERVRRGESFALDDWLLPLERNGYLENCWFTVSYSPIRDETGGVGGLLAVVAETTGRVEGRTAPRHASGPGASRLRRHHARSVVHQCRTRTRSQPPRRPLCSDLPARPRRHGGAPRVHRGHRRCSSGKSLEPDDRIARRSVALDRGGAIVTHGHADGAAGRGDLSRRTMR